MDDSGHPVVITGGSLSVEEIVRVARRGAKVEIAPEVKLRLDRMRAWMEKYVKESLYSPPGETEKELRRRMIYGVTTGFGTLKDRRLHDMDAAHKLQENLIVSHCTGTGPAFSDEVVRAVMLVRANTLAAGRSGVRYELLSRLVEMLNSGALPVVPEQGSVGASGDLAPMAHLALSLIGKGPVRYRGKEYANLAELNTSTTGGIPVSVGDAFELKCKEGLALLNGTSVMAAQAALALHDARRLLDWADAAGAVTMESLLGATRAFDEIVFSVYKHRGAAISAGHVRRMTAGSELVNRSAQVHDPYSVRCIPQVHGAARDAIAYAGETIETHLGAITDDPIFFTADEVEKSPPADGWSKRLHFEEGHFHGEPLAMALDMLAIAIAEIASISERRIQTLLDPNHSRGLPGCLIDNPVGINSGYMLAQYTAASLVSENKTLAHPACVDSIPTSANAEDHVSMGAWAARKARRVVENARNVLAIELLCATEALSFRTGRQEVTAGVAAGRKKLDATGAPGAGTQWVYDLVRIDHAIPHLDGADRNLKPLIDTAAEIIGASDLSEFFGVPG
ncbi:MAG: histidine ammonia-lyase [bacterium]|jgi:histidine ammonia-lyase